MGWGNETYTRGVDTTGVVELAAFLIGLLFGSFLNVCISRLPRHQSVVRPGSRCPECGAGVRWYDNIPLLSWILLRGRCRDCGQQIPWRYPVVELGVGLWFAKVVGLSSWIFSRGLNSGVGGGIKAGFDSIASGAVQGVGLAVVGFLLIGLMVMDWQTLLLPDAFTLTGIAIGFFLICVRAAFLGPTEGQVLLTRHHIQLTSPGGVVDRGNLFFTGPEGVVMGRVAAVCGAALVLLAVRWLYKAVRHREGMGLGDVKLLAMIAAFLGFWPAMLALFLGSLVASLYAAVLLVLGRAGAASKLAFGSFLCVGGLVTAMFGSRIIAMYTSLLY